MERIEGLSIGLDLDSLRLERGLTGLKDKLKTVNSEMKANMSAFDRSDKSIGKIETRLQGLNKKLEVHRQVTKEAKAEYEKMVKEHGEGSKEAEKAAREYNNQASALNNLERYVEGVTDELKQLKEQQRIAESSWGRLGKSMEEYGTKLTNVGDKMKDVGKSWSMYVTAPIVGFGALAAKTGIDFDDSMAKVQAVSGATGDDLLKLRDKAKEMGATTKFSASDSADAMNYMALAGWETKDMIDGLDGVMALAAASGEDLASVSDIVTDGLSAFGLKAKDSARMADVLAAASSTANTDVAGLGAAFKYVAPVAGALNYSIEDTSKAIGLMANSGIKGEKAGTALRTMMTNLSTGAGKAGDKMKELGISLKNQDGSMKSFDEVMQNIRKSFSGLTEDQQASAAATIFGKEAMSGALAVINASEGDYNKLGKAINNSEGAAKKMSDIMEGTLGGTIREIKSGLEGFAISIYEYMLPALEKGADKVKGFVGWLNNLSPKMKTAGVFIAAFAAAIGPTLLAFGTFISLTGKAMTTLAPLTTTIFKAGGLLGYLKAAFLALTGPVGIIVGVLAALTVGFVILYKQSDTFREGVHNLIGKLKELGGKALGSLKKGVGAAVGFFKEQGKVLQDFWKENGETIIQGAKNVGSIIGTIFKGIWKVIKFVMPAVLAIIKMVWGNIKGVIQGAIKVIMGVIQVFSGLFTGDFKKMWTGIKNIFKGALQFIWNFVQLMMWGKLLKGIVSLGKLLINAFRNSWKTIGNTVSKFVKNIVNFVKDRFTKSRDTVNGIFMKLKDLTKIAWNGMKKIIVEVVKSAVNTVRLRFSAARDNIRNIFDKIKELTKSAWNSIKNRIINPVKSAVSSIRDRFSAMRQTISDIFKKTRDKVSGYVTSMVKTVKDMPGKMAKGIKDMGYKLYDSAKGVANRLVKGLGKGVNGVIGGVNWVLGKLNVKTRLDEWTVPEYAQGTKGHPQDGPAIVGDGTGRLKGRELVQTPDGQSYLSPAKPTLVNLPKGTQVFSALETKSILGDVPKYAKGTGGMVKSGLKKLKDVALNVWSYASNPGKLLDLALTTLGIKKPDNANLIGKIASGGFNMIKSNAVDYVKSMFAKAEQEGGNLTKPNFGGRFRFTSGFGMRWGRLHGGVDYAAPEGTPIPSQSGGHVSYAGYGWNGGFGNLVKVRQGIYEHYYAHMSRIIAKAGQAVSKGAILGLVGNTGDSKGAHVHYEIRKNGVRLNPHAVGSFKGFATGGLVKHPGVYGLAEGGYPEYVIPTDPRRRTDAMKLLALAGREISGNKRPHQLPNPGTGEANDPVLVKLLDATLQQNKILMELLYKDWIMEVDGRSIAKVTAPYVKEINEFKDGRKKSFRGGVTPV